MVCFLYHLPVASHKIHNSHKTLSRATSAFGMLVVAVSLLTAIPTRNAHTYSSSLLHQGGGFTAGTDLSRPLGIFFDTTTNECYVTDTGNHQVIVYDEFGMPVYRFYHHVDSNGKRTLGEPKNLVVDTSGRIFLTDATVPYLDVLDHNGRRIATIEPPIAECGENARFDNVALGPDERVYAIISGTTERFVAVIGPNLAVDRILLLTGNKDENNCLTGIGVDEAGRIHVTDPCAEFMVQIYDSDGEYLIGFGRHDSGFENFSHPSSIVVMPNGEMWIVDSIRQVVSCFSTDGKFISYIGGKGDQPGAFNYPSGVTTDGKDRLFVLERAGNRYQCFKIVNNDLNTVEE